MAGRRADTAPAPGPDAVCVAPSAVLAQLPPTHAPEAQKPATALVPALNAAVSRAVTAAVHPAAATQPSAPPPAASPAPAAVHAPGTIPHSAALTAEADRLPDGNGAADATQRSVAAPDRTNGNGGEGGVVVPSITLTNTQMPTRERNETMQEADEKKRNRDKRPLMAALEGDRPQEPDNGKEGPEPKRRRTSGEPAVSSASAAPPQSTADSLTAHPIPMDIEKPQHEQQPAVLENDCNAETPAAIATSSTEPALTPDSAVPAMDVEAEVPIAVATPSAEPTGTPDAAPLTSTTMAPTATTASNVEVVSRAAAEESATVTTDSSSTPIAVSAPSGTSAPSVASAPDVAGATSAASTPNFGSDSKPTDAPSPISSAPTFPASTPPSIGNAPAIANASLAPQVSAVSNDLAAPSAVAAPGVSTKQKSSDTPKPSTSIPTIAPANDTESAIVTAGSKALAPADVVADRIASSSSSNGTVSRAVSPTSSIAPIPSVAPTPSAAPMTSFAPATSAAPAQSMFSAQSAVSPRNPTAPVGVALRAVPASSSGNALAPTGGALPLLRSSPVAAPGALGSVEGVVAREAAPEEMDAKAKTASAKDAEKGNNAIVEKASASAPDGQVMAVVESSKDSKETACAPEAKPEKKQRNVSWATEDKLVSVQYIDTRLELVKSWDPDSQITLPFSPATLSMFKSMSEEQQRNESEPSAQSSDAVDDQKTEASKLSAFEAARKKEHDMEQERARKAREEQQRLLNEMAPTRAWVRPGEIVLPTECRIEKDAITYFSVVEEGYRNVASRRRSDAETPPSPPPELRSPVSVSEVDIPLIPLSDGDGDTAGDGQEVVTHARNGNARHNDYRGYNSNADGAFRGYANGSNMPHNQRRGNGIGDHNRRPVTFDMQNRGGHGSIESRAGPSFAGMDGNFLDKNTPVPPQAMQNLLSALQSSGLLNNVGANHGRNGSDDYNGDQRRVDRNPRGDMYMERHQMPNQGGNGRSQDSGPNVNYMDDSRRRGEREDHGMGVSSGMAPQPPMMGHPGQVPPGFPPPGMQQPGMMEGFPFGMPPPMPPPGMGLPPNMMPMPMGLPMPPPMGMPMPPFGMPPGPMMNGSNAGKGGAKGSKSGPGGGRQVETITRPKSKGSKQRKKCKYFGTKQGCRDGSSCIYAHN